MSGENGKLPRRTRPRIYASAELFLDMLFSVRSRAPEIDLETLLIYLIVNEATMRPMLVGPTARHDLIEEPFPPEDVRGAISRALIAERASLPRETVRRKVNQLIKHGLLMERRDGEVQPVPRLAEAMFQDIADECYEAVRRFDLRLRTFDDGLISKTSD